MAWRTSFVLVLKRGDEVKASRGSRPSLRVCRWARCRCSGAVPGIRYASSLRHDGRSSRAAFVPIMRATDLRGIATTAPSPGVRDSTRNRRIFIQRQMRTGPFVARTIERHQPLQARFIEHDHVIESLTTSKSKNRSTNGFWCVQRRLARSAGKQSRQGKSQRAL
jgi:hypothetical protein